MTDMLRRVNFEALGLIAKSNQQRDKYTKEIVKLKCENQRILKMVEQLRAFVQEKQLSRDSMKLDTIFSAGLYQALDREINQVRTIVLVHTAFYLLLKIGTSGFATLCHFFVELSKSQTGIYKAILFLKYRFIFVDVIISQVLYEMGKNKNCYHSCFYTVSFFSEHCSKDLAQTCYS